VTAYAGFQSVAMKRLFGKSKSPPPVVSTSVPNRPALHTTPLPPSHTLPSVPHPCPFNHLAILPASEGLLIRPHIVGLKHPATHVRVCWGKTPSVEELEGDGEADGRDWTESVVVYGIMGIVELYTSKIAFHVKKPHPIISYSRSIVLTRHLEQGGHRKL
jgi:phosphatidylinositol 4-phosphatase